MSVVKTVKTGMITILVIPLVASLGLVTVTWLIPRVNGHDFLRGDRKYVFTVRRWDPAQKVLIEWHVGPISNNDTIDDGEMAWHGSATPTPGTKLKLSAAQSSDGRLMCVIARMNADGTLSESVKRTRYTVGIINCETTAF